MGTEGSPGSSPVETVTCMSVCVQIMEWDGLDGLKPWVLFGGDLSTVGWLSSRAVCAGKVTRHPSPDTEVRAQLMELLVLLPCALLTLCRCPGGGSIGQSHMPRGDRDICLKAERNCLFPQVSQSHPRRVAS